MGKSYRGDAIVTTLTADIAPGDLTIGIANSTGWPSGAGGKPFVVELRSDAIGTVKEKILVASRTGLTLSVASRAYDDTLAAAFVTGAEARHVYDAVSAQAAADHIEDPDPAGHSSLLNPARHDLPARHTFGGALLAGTVSAPVGATQSPGSGDAVARANHAHALDPTLAGPGLTLLAGILGVLADDATITISGDTLIVKPGGIGATHLGSQVVGTGAIAPAAITAPLVADGAVSTAAKVVDGILTFAKMVAGVPRGFIGEATLAADSPNVAVGPTLVGSFAVTWTGVANRRYLVMLQPRMGGNNASPVAGDPVAQGSVLLNVDGALLRGQHIACEKLARAYGGAMFGTIVPGAGSHTANVQITKNNGDSVYLNADAYLLVTDIGGV